MKKVLLLVILVLFSLSVIAQPLPSGAPAPPPFESLESGDDSGTVDTGSSGGTSPTTRQEPVIIPPLPTAPPLVPGQRVVTSPVESSKPALDSFVNGGPRLEAPEVVEEDVETSGFGVYLIVIVVLLLILIGFLVYWVHRHKQVGEQADDLVLNTYISKCVAKGYNKAQIRSLLHNYGWQDDQISKFM